MKDMTGEQVCSLFNPEKGSRGQVSYLHVQSGGRGAHSWLSCTPSSVPPEHRCRCQTARDPPGYRTDRAEPLLWTFLTHVMSGDRPEGSIVVRSEHEGTQSEVHR